MRKEKNEEEEGEWSRKVGGKRKGGEPRRKKEKKRLEEGKGENQERKRKREKEREGSREEKKEKNRLEEGKGENKERKRKREKEGEEESKLEIERGLEEDTPEERRFCYFLLLSRRPNTSCIGKVGKTDLGLSYFLGEMDIFHKNFASFSTVLLLW